MSKTVLTKTMSFSECRELAQHSPFGGWGQGSQSGAQRGTQAFTSAEVEISKDKCARDYCKAPESRTQLWGSGAGWGPEEQCGMEK